MKTFLAFTFLLTSMSAFAGGYYCEALCVNRWTDQMMELKGGDRFFSRRDLFELMSNRCYGELIIPNRYGYKVATPRNSCFYSPAIPSNYAPEYMGRGF